MNETNPITLLAKLKPFAQHLFEVFDLENYSLSKAEKRVCRLFFGYGPVKKYSQLKLLRSQANMTTDEFECLEVMYTEIILRFLEGINMQTGQNLTIIGQWWQRLDGKINWEINFTRTPSV